MKRKRLNSHDIKKLYIDFFKSKGHTQIDNSPLIPQNDPSALFTTAGMHPLVPYLMGEPHPSGSKRLVNIQKALRTTDIDEVGRTRRHLTLFEMAGNWSLNDYFKKESLNWSFEFLTDPKWLGLDANRLYITVFGGKDDIPVDEESIEIWSEIFKKHDIEPTVARNPGQDNEPQKISTYPVTWWGPVAATGPCGPSSEIFYDTGKKHDTSFGPHCHPECECGRFIEVWNNVLMEFVKTDEGKLEQAQLKNIDTGLGVIRVALITGLMNNDGSVDGELTVYSTDVFRIQAAILWEFLFNEKLDKHLDIAILEKELPNNHAVAIKVVLEHMRSTAFISAEGLEPSNKDQGYILRRLLRRMTRSIMLLIDAYAPNKINEIEDLLENLALSVIEQYAKEYPHIQKHKSLIIGNLLTEIKKFKKSLKQGTAIFNKTATRELTAKLAFDLYQSNGFPFELTQEMAKERGVNISKEDFDKEFQKHKDTSKQSGAKHFKGGLGDTSKESLQYHTTTHLLHAALRKILGNTIQQKGSNITTERLRFDINLNRKLTDEEIKDVEEYVNNWIEQKLPVTRKEVTPAEADKMGALAFFKDKYGDLVSVYTIGEGENIASMERCGGPHVSNTGELGTFKITKQKKIGANSLRIKAKLT